MIEADQIKDIYITNIASTTQCPFSTKITTYTKDETKADLKVFFADLFERNDDLFGPIYQLSLNNSKLQNDSTFIGFLRMGNVGFHQTIINRYNGTMFRN